MGHNILNMKILLVAFVLGLTSLDLTQARIGTFWHVTDFHLDTNYSSEGDPSAMCWESRSSPRDPGDDVPGPFGDYLCDAPFKLIQSAVEAMHEIHPNPDFILWTGDDTAHVSDKYFSTDEVIEIIDNITETLRESFPETVVVPILGNHDYYPKNQLPPGESQLQTKVAGLWKEWFDKLNNDTYASFASSGRYVTDIEGTNVSIMALNTLIWYKNNNSTVLNDTADDPDGQFAWADEQLHEMVGKGRKVYLIGHIPPGTFERYQQKREGFHWYQDRYNKRFLKLIQDHYDVIEAQFFAHHHTDSFRLFFKDDTRNEDGTALSYQLLAPGVTPWKSTLSEETGANNPGIRLISYDTETGKLMEVTTYYLDLAKANKNRKAEWEFEYNFTSRYNLNEISATSLFSTTREMKNNLELFNKYYQANTVSYEDPEVCSNSPSCRKLHWCAITEIDYTRFYDCNSSFSTIPWNTPILLGVFSILGLMR